MVKKMGITFKCVFYRKWNQSQFWKCTNTPKGLAIFATDYSLVTRAVLPMVQ